MKPLDDTVVVNCEITKSVKEGEVFKPQPIAWIRIDELHSFFATEVLTGILTFVNSPKGAGSPAYKLMEESITLGRWFGIILNKETSLLFAHAICLMLGFCGMLNKPLTRSDIIAAVKSFKVYHVHQNTSPFLRLLGKFSEDFMSIVGKPKVIRKEKPEVKSKFIRKEKPEVKSAKPKKTCATCGKPHGGVCRKGKGKEEKEVQPDQPTEELVEVTDI
jgi:hypothetical protein